MLLTESFYAFRENDQVEWAIPQGTVSLKVEKILFHPTFRTCHKSLTEIILA